MVSNYVRVEDTTDDLGNRFFDTLDFGGLVDGTINSLTLTLNFSHAPVRGVIAYLERWDVYGSETGGTSTSDRTVLGTLNSTPQTTWSTTLTSGDVFDQAVADGEFRFWFGDEGILSNDFRLYSLNVTVDYTPSPVPLPAGLPLLASGLVAFGLLHRRRKSA